MLDVGRRFAAVWAVLWAVGLCAGCTDGGSSASSVSVENPEAVESAEPIDVAETDWPWWRGPNSNGVANTDSVPVEWSESENVIWKTPVPGRGHSSPTIVGDRIFLTTADEEAEIQSVLCYDRASGEQLWKKDLHEGGFDENAHEQNSQASPTVASDGQRIFAVFLNDATIRVTAMDFEGEVLWQTKAGGFDSRWGYGASPALYKSLVIVAADHKSGGYVAALHRETGEIIWRTPRPAEQSYSSAIVGRVAGRDQVLLCGCDLVCGYDPATGDELWSVKGTTTVTCGTMTWGGDLAFGGGGYPGSETIAVRADGSGEVAWRNRTKLYVPSPLYHKGHLYAINDGRAYCWDAETGERQWRGRLESTISRASPTLVGEHIYYPNVKGRMYVFKASPERFELVAENQLGEEAYATPVACRGRLYLRVADFEGESRQETLYCIGEESEG